MVVDGRPNGSGLVFADNFELCLRRDCLRTSFDVAVEFSQLEAFELMASSPFFNWRLLLKVFADVAEWTKLRCSVIDFFAVESSFTEFYRPNPVSKDARWTRLGNWCLANRTANGGEVLYHRVANGDGCQGNGMLVFRIAHVMADFAEFS